MTTTLSKTALNLLNRRLAMERVAVDDATLPLHLELAEAGMMIPLHTFAHGPNSAFRLSEAACDLRDRADPAPSGEATPSRRD